MSAPITIIIPTLNAADRIGPCLGALGEGLFEGLIREVIFADGGSCDAIAEVADEIGATLITAAKGRAAQMPLKARNGSCFCMRTLCWDRTGPTQCVSISPTPLTNPLASN